MSKKGFIKLDRKLLTWGWFNDARMVKFWIYLLLSANHQDGYLDGVLVKRGQVLVGRKKLARDLNLGEQIVRTMINRLKSTNEITTESTNKYTLITILKWDEYQGGSKKSTSNSTNKSTNDQPATNQQLTTNKNVKNVKKERNIYIRDRIPVYDTSKNKQISTEELNELLSLKGEA